MINETTHNMVCPRKLKRTSSIQNIVACKWHMQPTPKSWWQDFLPELYPCANVVPGDFLPFIHLRGGNCEKRLLMLLGKESKIACRNDSDVAQRFEYR